MTPCSGFVLIYLKPELVTITTALEFALREYSSQAQHLYLSLIVIQPTLVLLQLKLRDMAVLEWAFSGFPLPFSVLCSSVHVHGLL